MRLSDLFFGLLVFSGGVIAGVFLQEANVVTGDHIRKVTRKTVDKVRGVGQVESVE